MSKSSHRAVVGKGFLAVVNGSAPATNNSCKEESASRKNSGGSCAGVLKYY